MRLIDAPQSTKAEKIRGGTETDKYNNEEAEGDWVS
jgi:hypothetical protein